MAKPVILISGNGSSNYRNIISSLMQCLNNVLHRMLKTKVEPISSVVPDSGSAEISKREQKTIPRIQDSPSQAEMLSVISELKGSFEESVNSLNSCEEYLESSTVEKAPEPLHLRSNLGEKKGYLAAEKIEKILGFLISECSMSAENDAGVSQDFDRDSSCSETCSWNSDTPSDCVSTLSEEASKRDSIEDSSNVSEVASKRDSVKDSITVAGETSEGYLKEDLAITEILNTFRSLSDQIRNFDVEAIVDKLEDKIRSQRKQLESLKNENREILADFGEELVLRNAEERKEENPEQFQQLAPLSSYTIQHDQYLCYKTGCDNSSSSNETPHGFQEPQTTNGNLNPPLTNEALFCKLAEKKTMGKNDGKKFEEKDQDDPRFFKRSKNKNQSLKKHKTLKIQMKKTSSGEGIKSRGHEAKTVSVSASTSQDDPAKQNSMQNKSCNGVKGSCDATTSPEDKRNVQSNSTRQEYEGLSFSVQQDDFNGKECISLSFKPVTSVATMLYNNYKLLLLTISQSLLSSDIISLKDWANQNFSIENALNAFDVFVKLDEKGAINAEDLRSLRGFFESITRYDLLHMIDAFLLGDYSLLRQVPGPEIRQGVRNTSRYLDVSAFNAEIPSPTTRGNVENPARTRNLPNSNMVAFPSSLKHQNTASNAKPSFIRNENQPTPREQQDLKPIATGFSSSKVTNMVVPDGPVSCKFFIFLKQFHIF